MAVIDKLTSPVAVESLVPSPEVIPPVGVEPVLPAPGPAEQGPGHEGPLGEARDNKEEADEQDKLSQNGKRHYPHFSTVVSFLSSFQSWLA